VPAAGAPTRPHPSAPDEPASVRLAAAGDRDARAGLLARHGPRVYGLCRRLDPDPSDAYQEAWEKIFRGLPSFDPDGPASLRTWLTVVTTRNLVDRARRRKVRGDVIALGEPVDPAPPVDARLDEAQRRARLEVAVARLPEDWRRVVVGHHYGELPLEELAEAEGVAVGTIKSRLHRARARLLTWLGERGSDD
jgi:RNA polymerase sigma-70 factor (ECF subfamily)